MFTRSHFLNPYNITLSIQIYHFKEISGVETGYSDVTNFDNITNTE